MITLDPAQLYALRKSESEAIQAAGGNGTGKSTLANAIAAQSARNGLSCLLIGLDPSLDHPIAFRMVDHVHQVLSERSQLNSQTDVSRPGIVQRSTLPFDPIEARAKVDPIAAKAALSLLRRARELIQQFKFDADEVEESVTSNQALPAETLDLAFLAADDAAKLADELWSGNARAGRSFRDLKDLLAGANVEIPANEHTLKLILCDDAAFEAALLKLLSRRSEQKEEQAIAAVVSQLRRPRSAEKSLADCHQHAVWMSRVLNDAIALVRKHGSLKAALAANPDSDGAKAIGHFIRMRPDQGSASAVRAFDSALRDYQHDSATLDPQLNQYGSRPLGSFARPTDDGGQQVEANPGSFVQRIRSARYAARQLPGLLERIRASLPRSLGQRFESVAIEDAGAVLEAGTDNSPRQRAATEVRQLRALFTETGFGDPFSAPPDFESRIENARPPVATTKVATSTYNAEVLDLLLDLTTYKEYGNLIDWPTSIVRARRKEELVEIAESGRKFDVVVADDAPNVAAQLLDAFATNGAVVHRIGVSDEDAILLEIPHRQQDAEVASAASGQPNRWLGAPDGIGLIVRSAPDLTSEQLHSAAGRLLMMLKNAGCNVDLANSDAAADFIVASRDELHDADLPILAGRARKGLAILCRHDRRTNTTTVEPAHSPDVLLAQSLGWRLVVETADGALLEKGGRAAVLVDETVAMDGRDETVADVARRLGAIGWQPIVSWRASPRTPEEFGKLLNDRAVAVNRRYRTIAETFDLKSPIPPGGDSKPPNSPDVKSAPTAGTVPATTTMPVREATSESRLLQRLSGDNAPRTPNEAPVVDQKPDDGRRVAPTAEIVPLVPRPAANDRTALLPDIGPIAQTLSRADKETAIIPSVDATRGDAGKHTKVEINPTLLDSVFIENGGQHLPIPHIARLVVSTALQTKATDPICIILPSTEQVAQFTAILASLQCLAADFSDNQKHFIDRYFKPGSGVRILPDGNVFVVGEKSTGLGIDGIFLGFTEKETLIGDGRRLAPNGELFRYEPTTRQLPKSKRSIKFNDPERTKVDELAGVRTFGNSGLNKNRIILVGSQKEFGRVLEGLSLVSQQSNQVRKPLADRFAWGNFDENGQPFALYPEGSGGAPLVAIARDLAELERASLHPDVEAGSQIVLTDRLEHVLKNLDLANRVGERQRLIVFADGRKRADALTLRKNGWKVWEPQPWELLSPLEAAESTKTGLLGFDRTLYSASAERRPGLAYLPKSARALSSAYELLGKLGEVFSAESAVDDLRMQASMETVREIFFSVANWLSVPPSAQLAECSASLQHLRGEQTYVSRYLGPDAGSAVGAFADAIESFVTSPRKGGITPKGEALLELARNAALNPTLKQVLVTGSRQSREEADAFLAANSIDLQCKLATELTDGDEFLSAISFSILRRDMFEKFIDPWPSKEIVLAGYDFEVDLYKRRLRARGSQKKRLELNSDVRTSLTSLPATSFGSPTPATDADNLLPEATLDQQSEPFEQFSRLAKSDAPRPIRIDISSNEHTEDAHIVRFVGQSWMPMAVDYRPVCLVQGGSEGRKSGVEHIEISDLRPGMRIIVREGGEKDVIKAVAQDICGDEKYERLWKRASLWRDALKSGDSDPSRVARRLQDSGVRRHIVTLRSWLTNPSLIGPRSDDDVLAIAKAFPIEGKFAADWKGCCEAISELRGLHLSAGTRLADHLVTRCGRMLLEPTETETAVEFQLGTVWILEVADVEPATRSAPSGLINRLQWLNNAWQARRYGERLKIMAA